MKKDRTQTEQKIYNAFLEILETKGPNAVGINAIAKEAGVSKELIYRYFGGMKGLLEQFAKSGGFSTDLPSASEITDVKALKQFAKASTQELRSNKIAQEILRWQLTQQDENTEELFNYTNQQLGALFTTNEDHLNISRSLQLMLGGYAYFTLLSKFKTKYQTVDLSSDTTWEEFDEAIMTTIDKLNKH